jgi:hypothetical protein
MQQTSVSQLQFACLVLRDSAACSYSDVFLVSSGNSIHALIRTPAISSLCWIHWRVSRLNLICASEFEAQTNCCRSRTSRTCYFSKVKCYIIFAPISLCSSLTPVSSLFASWLPITKFLTRIALRQFNTAHNIAATERPAYYIVHAVSRSRGLGLK